MYSVTRDKKNQRNLRLIGAGREAICNESNVLNKLFDHFDGETLNIPKSLEKTRAFY